MIQKHILLIEDDEDDQLFFVTALKQIPYATCTIASNIRIALSVVDRQHITPDIIFLDLHIPFNRGGNDFITEMQDRKLMALAPIFVLSSDLREKDVLRLKELGIKKSFNKPNTMKELEDIIKGALGEVENADKPLNNQ